MTADPLPGWNALPTLLGRRSLKFRLLILTVGLFVLVIWGLAFSAARVMESHLQQLLTRQQFAATVQMARELEYKLRDNLDGLQRAAAGLPTELDPKILTSLLAQRPLMHVAFSGGLMVVGLDGKAIARYPAADTSGINYADRDWFKQVVASGQPYVDKPIIGRVLLRPVLTLAAPVFDAAGRVHAVLIGGVDLSAPNFLGFVNDPEQVGDGEVFVFSLRDQLIIAATDRQRVMTASPKRGSNLLFDRMVDGFDGSGVAISSQGIPKLYSGKRVPVADWLVLSAMPTEIAFRPLWTMQNYLYAFAALLTLVAAMVSRLIVRRLFKPLDEAAQAIGQMTAHQRELAPLPVPGNDEIGGLVRNFNQLLADRLSYEEAMVHSERRFRLLVEGAPDAIFIQTGGRFAYVNSAALSLFGAGSEQELLGQPILDRIHPDYRPMISERIRRINNVRLSNPALEQIYLRLDGSSVPVEASAVPFRFGGEDGALVFARDITDKKNVILELNLYRGHLEELVAERTTQLAAAKQAAEVATRAKSDFLATMSHEIRNPLSAVVGLAELLVTSPLDRQQRDCAEQIRYSAQSLRKLIDDILDFSKIEAEALHLEQAPFSLNTLLRTTATVLSVGARGKPVEVLFDVASEVPDALLGDALRLQQILLNLGGNAVKFTEAGSVVVVVRCLQQESGRATLRFAVRDTGIGIPVDQQERIFDLFTQADSSTSRRYGGTGLGLTISNRLAALMGSQIALESQVGQGSEFHFSITLPLSNAGPVRRAREQLAGLNLLIIDDHPLSREILARTCAGFGWRATTLASAAAGLDELRRSCADGCDYDLLLLDWHMPDMDGFELLRQARATPGIGLPLVILMANSFELEQLAAAGEEHFLDGVATKPLIPESLFEAVCQAYHGEGAVLEAAEPPDRLLQGWRLLVAEDNEINRGLIEKILQRLGAEVVLAVNGLAAVEMLKQPGPGFDAVLMDLQMPVMDGYMASRAIRDELGLHDLPIIAVTAHAMPEEREKTAAAGINDLVVKPIDVEALLNILLKKGPGQGEGAAPAAYASAELAAWGWDEESYGKLLRQLLDAHGGDVDEACRLFAEGDRQGAARLVHQLAGVSSFLRQTELAGAALAVEKALAGDAAADFPGLFEALRQAIQRLADSMR